MRFLQRSLVSVTLPCFYSISSTWYFLVNLFDFYLHLLTWRQSFLFPVKWQNNSVTRLMSFIQWKTIHGLGDIVPRKRWSTVPKGFGARESFVEVRRGNPDTAWLAGRVGISCKTSRSCFLGQGGLAEAELEDCDRCRFGFLDRWSRKFRLTGLDLWHGPAHSQYAN